MADGIVGGSYNEFPYPSLSYGLTHPDRLATAATLFGISPAPVEQCRVLDIGCAVGGNIIPMAYTLPDSIFTGIDYSLKQIEIGQERLAELGAVNIRLQHMDIMDVPEDFGEFDYIIAHGIYSWIPEDVRDQLMAVIKRHLAPNGIAYISYNVYPGWHMISMVRGMMQYRTRDISDPNERITKAKELIALLDTLPYEDNQAFGAFIESYHKSLTERFEQGDERGETLLLHDELAEVNDPIYFHEFAEHANSHGLQYVSEVELFEVSPYRFPEEVAKQVGQMATDAIEFEQYLDFLRTRTFRKSILCHKEIAVSRRIRPDIVAGLFCSSFAKADSDSPDLNGATIEQFKGQDGSIFATDHPLTKSVMLYLSKNAPGIFAFDDLVSASAAMLDADADRNMANEIEVLTANLLRAYSYNESLLQFHVYQPTFVTEISERPEASLVARWQAANFSRVTNLRHGRISLDKISLLILTLLDGQRDQEAILDELMNLYKKGNIVLTVDKKKKTAKPKSTRTLMKEEIERNLEFFSDAALLVA